MDNLIDIDTGTNELLCSVGEGVAIITLNRPEKRNALSKEMTLALRRMIQERDIDGRVRALVITGDANSFCAGGNVSGMGENDERSIMSAPERIADLIGRQRLLTGSLLAFRKPTIAALSGPAVGAGLAIALACDMRIASRTAFVSAGYSRVGLSGDYGISWLLTRTVGSSIAREMMLLSRPVDSARAERVGLFNRVVPNEELLREAFDWAKSMADGPAQALRAIKDNLDDAGSINFNEAIAREAERIVACAQTADHKEAVRAFVEKRKPQFSGQ